jgi:uncharacterized protein (TIGR02611 family)
MKEKVQEKIEGVLPKTDIPGLAQARRIVVAVIGFTVLIVGVCLLVLPGPAFIVIPAGLAILASEFVWARRLLRRAKETFHEVKDNYMPDKSDRNGGVGNKKSGQSSDGGS